MTLGLAFQLFDRRDFRAIRSRQLLLLSSLPPPCLKDACALLTTLRPIYLSPRHAPIHCGFFEMSTPRVILAALSLSYDLFERADICHARHLKRVMI